MDDQLQRKFSIGQEYYRAGKFAAALPLLLEVAAAHETYADVHNMLGIIEYQLGRPESATQHFVRALELNPHYAEAALHLSICYDEQGRYEEARDVYARATRSRGAIEEAALNQVDELARTRVAHLHGELGDMYASLGLPGRALREYQAALASGVRFPDIRLKLATTLRDLGRVTDALGEFLHLKSERPEYLPARLQLGVTLWAAGRPSEARTEWDYVLAREPNNRLASFYKQAAAARRQGTSGPKPRPPS